MMELVLDPRAFVSVSSRVLFFSILIMILRSKPQQSYPHKHVTAQPKMSPCPRLSRCLCPADLTRQTGGTERGRMSHCDHHGAVVVVVVCFLI